MEDERYRSITLPTVSLNPFPRDFALEEQEYIERQTALRILGIDPVTLLPTRVLNPDTENLLQYI